MPHIMEYLDTVCHRMLERGGGGWNIEQPRSELQLINLGKPAQPQYSWCLWRNVSSSSLLLIRFTCLSTELLLVFKVYELGLCHSKAAKLYPHRTDSGSSVALSHQNWLPAFGRHASPSDLISRLSKKYLHFC